MALPSNVQRGVFTGTILQGGAGKPVAGLNIQFIPQLTIPILKNATSTPPTLINLIVEVAGTDEFGVITSIDGSAGQTLISTQDTDLDQTGWTWQCVIEGPTFPRVAFSFEMPVDGVIDITTVIEVPPNLGEAIAAWQAATAATLQYKADAAGSADAAADSATLAGQHRTAVEAVVATSDGIMRAALDIEGGAFQSELTATIDGLVTAQVPGEVSTAVTNEDIPGKVAAQIAAQAGKVVIGSGSPQGVVTAGVGTIYSDTVATLGVSVWRKATGTGSSGWVVIDGDTGWRNMLGSILNNWGAGNIKLRRVNGAVMLSVLTMNKTSSTASAFLNVPAGFRPDSFYAYPVIQSGSVVATGSVSNNGDVNGDTSTLGVYQVFRWPCDQMWPTTLPGTAA